MLLAGCVVLPGKRVSFNDVKIGMPRDEAVAILGKPHRVSAKGNVEHLYYNESALYIGIFGVGKDPKQNRDLARVEQVKKVWLMRKELDHDDGEVTATMKVRRAKVYELYGDQIEALYAD